MPLKVSSKPRKRNSPRIAEKDAPGFLQYIRGRQCLFCGAGGCSGPIQAAHLDFAGGKGMGTKVADRFTVPMCAAHHAQQHAWGWGTFRRKMEVSEDDLLNAAAFLWSRWPGRIAWERKQND